MASIKLEIRTNFRQASEAMKSLGAVTDAESARLRKYNEKFTGGNIDKWAQSNKRAVLAVKAVKGAAAAAAANKQNLERKIQSLIRNGIDPEDAKLKGLKAQLVQATGQTGRLARSSGGMGRAMNKAAVAVAALGAGAAAMGAKSFRSFADYSKGLANINTLLPITAGGAHRLDSELTRISETLALSKTELAGGVYQAVSAGASGLAEALAVTEQAAKLAKGALVDNAASVDILTTAMNAYGPGVVDAARASDVFFGIIRGGKINGEELSAVIGQSISLYAQAGVPLEHLGAGLAQLTKSGVSASESTTQLNGIITAFIKPSKKMEQALHRQGISSGSALLKTRGLSGALDFLNRAARGNSEAMAGLVPNVNALKGATSLASGGAEGYRDALADLADSAGATDEAVRVQTEGFSRSAHQVELAKTAIANLAIGLGEELAPVVAETVGKFTDWVKQAGGVRGVLEKIRPAITGIGVALASLTAGIAAYKIAMVLAAGATTAATGGVSLLIAGGVAGLTAGLAYLVKGVKWLHGNWDTVQEFIRDSLIRIGVQFREWGAYLKFGLSLAFLRVKEAVVDVSLAIYGGLLKAFTALLDRVRRLLDLAAKIPGAGDRFKGMSDSLREFSGRIDENIRGLQGQRDAVKETSASAAEGLRAETEAYAALEKAKLKALAAVPAPAVSPEPAAEITSIASERLAPAAAGITGGDPPDIIPASSELQDGRLKKLADEAAQVKAIRMEWVALHQGNASALTAFGTSLDKNAVKQENLSRTLSTAGKSLYSDLKGLASDYFKLEQENIAADLASEKSAIAEKYELERAAVNNSGLDEEAKREKIALINRQEAKEKADAEKHAARESYRIQLIAFNVNKATKLAELAMASSLAMIAAWQVGPIAGPIMMGVIGALAAVQAGIITSQKPPPPPSFQMGGRFVVPDGSRPDGVGLRVNPGEVVDITPRGETEERQLTVNVQLDSETVYTAVQKGLDEGDITVDSNMFKAS